MKLDVSKIKKDDCCGCTACKSVCPKNAIKMEADRQGFLYPIIDFDKCIHCGLCYKACDEATGNKNNCIAAFAAKNKNLQVLANSSSGGASFALCKTMIENGGVVYGVSYDSTFNVITTRADTIADCEQFYGSKYVQTDEEESFTNVYKDLRENRNILFFGTSCHVAGLLSFLNLKKCDTSNLITVDLICHGTPSPKLFADYVEFLGGYKKISNIFFRYKKGKYGDEFSKLPWRLGRINCCTEYKNGKRKLNDLKSKVFTNLFFSNCCLRPNCYGCKYIGEMKPADITISDYWGIEDAHPELADNLGTSAIMIHTHKGYNFIEKCDMLNLTPSTVDKISKKQGNMKKPSPKSHLYEEFWSDYSIGGFKLIARKYGKYNFRGFLNNSRLHKVGVKIRYGNNE